MCEKCQKYKSKDYAQCPKCSTVLKQEFLLEQVNFLAKEYNDNQYNARLCFIDVHLRELLNNNYKVKCEEYEHKLKLLMSCIKNIKTIFLCNNCANCYNKSNKTKNNCYYCGNSICYYCILPRNIIFTKDELKKIEKRNEKLGINKIKNTVIGFSHGRTWNICFCNEQCFEDGINEMSQKEFALYYDLTKDDIRNLYYYDVPSISHGFYPKTITKYLEDKKNNEINLVSMHLVYRKGTEILTTHSLEFTDSDSKYSYESDTSDLNLYESENFSDYDEY